MTTTLTGSPPAPPRDRLREQVAELSAIHRPSASPGERRAAEWIEARMRAHGARAHVETGRAHGSYWAPLTLLSVAGTLGALAGGRRRLAGAAVAGLAAAGIWDDITAGAHHARRLLRKRDTFNVVAELGPAGAGRTVVLVAHHDAAKSGLIFHPGIPAFVWRRFPALIERSDTSPPLMFPVFAGPALAALGSLLGSRRARVAGGVLAAGSAAVIGQIGSTRVVPGANDNVTGVVTLIELARRLADEPTSEVRVLLVSTGAEESFMEGMRAVSESFRHDRALLFSGPWRLVNHAPTQAIPGCDVPRQPCDESHHARMWRRPRSCVRSRAARRLKWRVCMKTSLLIASILFVGACASTGSGLPGRDGKSPTGNPPPLDDDKSDDAERHNLALLSSPELPDADRLYRRIAVEKAGTASAQVRLCVAPAGKVDRVDLVSSSGMAEYDQAVLDNVATWQYESFAAPVETRVCENLTVAYHAP
jgi:TonB family protein